MKLKENFSKEEKIAFGGSLKTPNGISFNDVAEFLKIRFEQYVNSDVRHSEDKNGKYYWKWLSTLQIANHFNVTVPVMRKLLSKGEKRGLIEAKRDCNWIEWYMPLPGYKNHPHYSDYVVKA